ncbi:MAG: hypothetical protein ISEC1_P0200 [Thiomicrorhabdus sp.]|nr:MAG: hypothetical protein ISEC1_P0200 [Thiomicrorhabdus sp.]
MSRLIDELKNDHANMAAALTEIKTLGITSEEGQKLLFTIKTSLLAHLAKEDRELYPVLKKAAETDPALQRTLDMYAADMDEISQAALAFFAKYSGGGSGMEFAKDLGGLFAKLGTRIRKEETTLYEKFNAIVD